MKARADDETQADDFDVVYPTDAEIQAAIAKAHLLRAEMIRDIFRGRPRPKAAAPLGAAQPQQS